MENAVMKREKVLIERWDPAEEIETENDVIAYLEGALEENDLAFLLRTIGHIARSEGMTRIARQFGVTRESLYTSLAPNGNVSFETVLKLLDRLGFRLKLEPKSPYVLHDPASSPQDALGASPIK